MWLLSCSIVIGSQGYLELAAAPGRAEGKADGGWLIDMFVSEHPYVPHAAACFAYLVKRRMALR